MPAKTIMVQGTASSVGKSVLVTALCRIFLQDGFRVAPFKAQNMALNSFVTREGGEIGRAQAVQAEASRIEPSVHMNPVLLKPEAEAKSQVIVLGKVVGSLKASEYYQHTSHLLDVIRESLDRLRSEYDIVVIEGAGSPAEVNLKDREIVNMRVARLAGSPVLLVGDIDRGGVFASIVGTLELLNPEERDLIRGLVINKFRGDLNLLRPGLDFLEQKTGKPVCGVVPYFRNISIAQEDSVFLDERRNTSATSGLDVAVIRLPHISNYDDFDPLEALGCNVRYITSAAELGNPDIIILPGTKSTIADLVHLQECGLSGDIVQKAKTGTPVVGICGGYQMLGRIIRDPYGIESSRESAPGLGLLDCETVFQADKTTTQVKAKVAADAGLLSGMKGMVVSGYEIHTGQTTTRGGVPPFEVVETPQGRTSYYDGNIDGDCHVLGSYLHGLFHNPEFTRAFLSQLRRLKDLPEDNTLPKLRDNQYDELADIVRQSVDISRIYSIMEMKHG